MAGELNSHIQYSSIWWPVATVFMFSCICYLKLYEELLACQQKLLEKQIFINSHPGNFEQLVA